MKSFVVLLALVIVQVQQARAQILTNFGSDQFTITYSDFTDVQTHSSLQISGNDWSELAGIISTVIIPASTIELTLTGTLSGANPGSAFQIALLDTAENTVYFDGSWGSYSPGVEMSAVLTRYAPVAGFNGQIVKVALFTAGSGASLNFTLKELRTTAVPEPSISLALLLGAICCAIRFRKRVVA
jgi:hypothetical protein